MHGAAAPKLRHAGRLTLPRSYIEATRNTHGPFAPFLAAALPRKTPGWACYEIDASHSPNITSPEALMALLDRAIRQSAHRHKVTSRAVHDRLILLNHSVGRAGPSSG